MATVTGKWVASLPACKALAAEHGGVFMVVSCNTKQCAYCKAAEAAVWNAAEWQQWAAKAGIPQYLADSSPAASLKIRNALHRAYNAPFWPTVFLFRLRDGANVTTTDVSTLSLDLLDKFTYRPVKPSAAGLIALVERHCCGE
jgi:hypothetical protein